jgi:hypothetical protein
MIAITVVASLVAYAWISGYIGGTTVKTGNSIQIQSFVGDTTAAGNLLIYVQNVGQGAVSLSHSGAVYVNDSLVAIYQPSDDPVSVPEGQTVAITVQPPGYHQGDYVRIKVVTTGGTSGQVTGTGNSGSVSGFTANVSPAGPLTLGAGVPQTFTASCSGNVGSLSYQWYLDGGPVSGQTASTYAHTTALGLHTVYVRITDSAVPPATVQSNTVSITVAGPATHFAVSGYPASVTAGTAHLVTVEALDALNNRATSYAGSVSITSSDVDADLPANGPLTSGLGTFSVTLNTVGTQSIIATDTVTPSITGTQSGITVTASVNPATHFAVSDYPASVTAGTAHSVTVEALDASNNRATSYAGTVHITSSDGAALLPANGPLTSGIGTFSVTLNTVSPPTVSITATDTVTPSITGTQSGITVTAASVLDHFDFSSIGVTQIVNTDFSITITAKDGSNNPYTGSIGTGTLAVSPTGTVSPSTVTFTAGVATMTVKIGEVHLTAVALTVSADSKSGTSTTFIVNPDALHHFTITGYPTSVTAGSSFGSSYNVVVTAYDQYGNVKTNYVGTVTFTSSDPSPGLPSPTAFTGGDNGAHTFAGTLFTLNTVGTGTQTITVTDGAVSVTTNPITVNAAPVGITFTANGLGTDTGTATVLTLGGTPYTYAQLPVTVNWVPGSDHIIEAASPVAGGSGIQYVWASWSDTGTRTHQYTTPSGSATVTANYGTQYQVTFDQIGLSGDASGTVLTVGSTTYTQGQLPLTGIWVDDGTTFSYAATVDVSGGTKQYAWTSNSGGLTSPIHSTGSVNGNYKIQWLCTFARGNIGSDAIGTVLTVGSTTYTYAQLPQTNIWVDDNTAYSYTSTVGAGTGKQYALTGTAGLATPIHGTGTVTPTYKTQYQVTFAVSPSGAGSITTPATSPQWYDAGQTGISIAASATGSNTFYNWSAPTGSATFNNQYSASTAMTISASGGFTVTANFVHYVDSNTAVHDIPNNGTHSNFNDMKNVGTYDTLAEGNVNGAESWVSPTGYTSSTWSNEANAYDGNTGTYASNDFGTYAWSDWLTLTYPPTTGNKLRYWVNTEDYRINNMQIDVYNTATSSWVTVYTSNPTTGSWLNVTFTSTMTTNSMRIRFYDNYYNYRTAYVYEMSILSVPTLNYQLDQEVQFTGATGYNQLQIQTGAFSGSENIIVQYWTGSTWANVGTTGMLTANSLNTFSVTVTGGSLQLRFIDETRTGDTTANTWQIDYVRLATA